MASIKYSRIARSTPTIAPKILSARERVTHAMASTEIMAESITPATKDRSSNSGLKDCQVANSSHTTAMVVRHTISVFCVVERIVISRPCRLPALPRRKDNQHKKGIPPVRLPCTSSPSIDWWRCWIMEFAYMNRTPEIGFRWEWRTVPFLCSECSHQSCFDNRLCLGNRSKDLTSCRSN